jgi:aquaporin NIP
MARKSDGIESQEITSMEEGLATPTDSKENGKFDCCTSPAAVTITQKVC